MVFPADTIPCLPDFLCHATLEVHIMEQPTTAKLNQGEACSVNIVVVRSPKFLRRLLRKVFGLK